MEQVEIQRIGDGRIIMDGKTYCNESSNRVLTIKERNEYFNLKKLASDGVLADVSMSDCPMCFNSSGLTLFMGRGSQKCDDCKGTGKVTNAKLKRLKKQYGDLIHSC